LRAAWAVACGVLVVAGSAFAAPPLELAPTFTVRTLDGKSIRMSEFKGQPVVLDFWATWCTPCLATMPHLDQLQTRYRQSGLVVIGLSVDDQPPVAVRRFASKLGVRFRLGMASERLLDDYGPIRSIPTTFFINRRGQIVRRVVGYVDAETMEGFAQEILRP
jgi:thiol-disulfide isomerase/thioredoxin